jgi:LysM repeat protein
MNKKVFRVLLVAVAMTLLLSACRLPASTAPQPTTAPESEMPFPAATNSNLVDPYLFATQTAIAGGQTANPQATAEPVQTGGGVATTDPNQTGGGTTTDQAGGGTTTDQSGGGTTTDQSGGGTTTDQSGGGTTTEQSGGGVTTQATPIPNYTLPAAPARPASYTIQKGEFPYCIARRYDVNPSALLSANGLGTSSQLSIGTVITIPAGTWDVANFGTRALRAHPTTYTVQTGDTLNSVACKFGDVYPEFIAAANGLAAGAALTPGAVINIP